MEPKFVHIYFSKFVAVWYGDKIANIGIKDKIWKTWSKKFS